MTHGTDHAQLINVPCFISLLHVFNVLSTSAFVGVAPPPKVLTVVDYNTLVPNKMMTRLKRQYDVNKKKWRIIFSGRGRRDV